MVNHTHVSIDNGHQLRQNMRELIVLLTPLVGFIFSILNRVPRGFTVQSTSDGVRFEASLLHSVKIEL